MPPAYDEGLSTLKECGSEFFLLFVFVAAECEQFLCKGSFILERKRFFSLIIVAAAITVV